MEAWSRFLNFIGIINYYNNRIAGFLMLYRSKHRAYLGASTAVV